MVGDSLMKYYKVTQGEAITLEANSRGVLPPNGEEVSFDEYERIRQDIVSKSPTPEPAPDPRQEAALEAIKAEPTDSPLRLAVESLLGLKTKEEVSLTKESTITDPPIVKG